MVFRLTALPGLAGLAGARGRPAPVEAASNGSRAGRSCSSWPPAARSSCARSRTATPRTCSPPPPRSAPCSPRAASRPTAAGLLLVARRRGQAVGRARDRSRRCSPRRAASSGSRCSRAPARSPSSAPRCSSTRSRAARLTSTGDLFHPHQIWWPFGVDAPAAFTAAGHGVKTSPEWLRADHAPADRRPSLSRSARCGGARRAAEPRRRARAAGRCCSCSAARSTPGTSSTTTCRWSPRSPRGRSARSSDWPVLALAVNAADLVHVRDLRRSARRTARSWPTLAWALPLAAYLAHRLYVRRAPLPYRRSWPVDPTSAGRLSSPSTSTT